MKSGYWTRELIVGLFHLITPYWNSEEKKSARLYLAAIIYPHNCRRIYDTAFKRMVQFFLQRFAEL